MMWKDSCKGITDAGESISAFKVKVTGKRGTIWWSAEIEERIKRKRGAWKRKKKYKMCHRKEERV